MTRKNKGSYHHGNLRAALVDVAERLIVEKGPGGFTLVEAATRAGVSPAAPYRHFKNREALLAEVAQTGFKRFADRLQAAWDDGRPDAVTALGRMGDIYMDFARYDRASYIAMFESDVHKAQLPELTAESDRAFALLQAACAALGGNMPDGSASDAERMAAHIWALSHGIATLFGDDQRKNRLDDEALKQLFRSGVSSYLRGLNIPA